MFIMCVHKFNFQLNLCTLYTIFICKQKEKYSKKKCIFCSLVNSKYYLGVLFMIVFLNNYKSYIYELIPTHPYNSV